MDWSQIFSLCPEVVWSLPLEVLFLSRGKLVYGEEQLYLRTYVDNVGIVDLSSLQSSQASLERAY